MAAHLHPHFHRTHPSPARSGMLNLRAASGRHVVRLVLSNLSNGGAPSWRKPLRNVLYLRTFGKPDIRPDARHVSKARPLSQDQQDADLAIRHRSVPMQDCWLVPILDCAFLHTWLVSDRPPPQNSEKIYRYLHWDRETSLGRFHPRLSPR